MTLDVIHPVWLLLAAALPAVWWISRRTLTDFSRAQLAAMTALRMLIVALLALALARVELTRPTSRVAVALAADVSRSVSDEALAAEDALVSALRERIGARLNVTAFDERARRAPDGETSLTGLRTNASAIPGTDVAAALRMARATLPAEHVGRVVLVTDGRETAERMLSEAETLKAALVELVVVELPGATRPEVLMAALEAPKRVTPGGTAEVACRVLSNRAEAASLEFFMDGFRIGEPQSVSLNAGENVLRAQVRMPESGSHRLSARVSAAEDAFGGNNQASRVIVLPEELKVLVVEQREEDAKYLARALRHAGLATDVRNAAAFPADMVDLDRYACVVLSDVPATSLSVAQMTLLKRYVEDLGGGFIMTGGEDSFGLGGYFRTPIEEILPVRLDTDKRKEEPTLAMMIVLDKSGSMEGKKVQLAKEASIATLQLLGPQDLVGVVTFDTESHLVQPLERVSGRAGITNMIAGIRAGGGTNMYPALEAAWNELRRAEARVKHVILLTDGKTHDGDYAGLIRRMAADRISVSSVAVGAEADVVLLQNVARWGRGRFYFTRDALSIPQIFARETATASRSAVVEEPFRPRVVRDVEAIRGIDFAKAPYLLGYIATRPKPLSEVILVGERSEPLLARTRVGLGKTVAFTSDVKNRWAAEWLSWPGFEKFWAQVVRDTMRTRASLAAEMALSFDSGRGVATLDALDAAGRFRNRLRVEGSALNPAGESVKLTFAQDAPGHYRATFDAAEPGTYLVSAQAAEPGRHGEAGEVSVVGGVLGEGGEYTSLEPDSAALAQLAERAGGRVISAAEFVAADPAELARELAAPSARTTAVRQALWPALLWIALALFLFDLALRRVDVASLWTARRRRSAP